MSEIVTWENANDNIQSVGNQIEDFLILHNAKLNCILNEIKILNVGKMAESEVCNHNWMINTYTGRNVFYCTKCGINKKQTEVEDCVILTEKIKELER